MKRNAISTTKESELSEQAQREINEFAKLILDIYHSEKRTGVKTSEETE